MVGCADRHRMSKRLGITSKLPNALSVSLGSCRDDAREMAVAYATVAAGGVYSKPHLITKVRDRAGSVVYRHKGVRRLAATRATNAALSKSILVPP